jgi:hypothetical protein
MAIPDWTIFYHDGSTFSSDDGEPQDTPGLGVLAIVIADDAVGYRVVQGGAGPPVYWDDGGYEVYSNITQFIAARKPE